MLRSLQGSTCVLATGRFQSVRCDHCTPTARILPFRVRGSEQSGERNGSTSSPKGRERRNLSTSQPENSRVTSVGATTESRHNWHS